MIHIIIDWPQVKCSCQPAKSKLYTPWKKMGLSFAHQYNDKKSRCSQFKAMKQRFYQMNGSNLFYLFSKSLFPSIYFHLVSKIYWFWLFHLILLFDCNHNTYKFELVALNFTFTGSELFAMHWLVLSTSIGYHVPVHSES